MDFLITILVVIIGNFIYDIIRALRFLKKQADVYEETLVARIADATVVRIQEIRNEALAEAEAYIDELHDIIGCGSRKKRRNT